MQPAVPVPRVSDGRGQPRGLCESTPALGREQPLPPFGCRCRREPPRHPHAAVPLAYTRPAPFSAELSARRIYAASRRCRAAASSPQLCDASGRPGRQSPSPLQGLPARVPTSCSLGRTNVGPRRSTAGCPSPAFSRTSPVRDVARDGRSAVDFAARPGGGSRAERGPSPQSTNAASRQPAPQLGARGAPGSAAAGGSRSCHSRGKEEPRAGNTLSPASGRQGMTFSCFQARHFLTFISSASAARGSSWAVARLCLLRAAPAKCTGESNPSRKPALEPPQTLAAALSLVATFLKCFSIAAALSQCCHRREPPQRVRNSGSAQHRCQRWCQSQERGKESTEPR